MKFALKAKRAMGNVCHWVLELSQEDGSYSFQKGVATNPFEWEKGDIIKPCCNDGDYVKFVSCEILGDGLTYVTYDNGKLFETKPDEFYLAYRPSEVNPAVMRFVNWVTS